MARCVGRLSVNNSALFLCDMQEKFRATISYYPQIIEVSRRMLVAAKLLDIPVIVTEQYPKGLGPTVSELDVELCPVFPKTSFSMLVPKVAERLHTFSAVKNILICGIESHVCVQQTVLDLLDADFNVHVVVDGVSSRSMVDRMYSLQRMRDSGAFLTTSESALLSLCRDAKHPRFKDIQQLITSTAPDSGLLGK